MKYAQLWFVLSLILITFMLFIGLAGCDGLIVKPNDGNQRVWDVK